MNFTQIMQYLHQSTNYEKNMKFNYKKLTSELTEFTNFLNFAKLLKNLPTSIHIAGSKGKGSIAFGLEQRFLDNKNGKKYYPLVYSSPHFTDLTERIRFAGVNISREIFAYLFTQLIPAFEEFAKKYRKLTFFEMTTALFLKAVDYYQPDILIVETGLGGRLDSTNSIPSQISVITMIELEHTQLLGNQLEQIAAEKAGIIKDNQIFILAPQHFSQVSEFFDEFLKTKQLKDVSILTTENKFKVQEISNDIIKVILNKLPMITTGFAELSKNEEICQFYEIPGRQQKIYKNGVKYILDGAHTSMSLLALKKSITAEDIKDAILIIGMNQDKLDDEILQSIPLPDLIITSGFHSPRCLNPQKLSTELQKLYPANQILTCPNSQTALAEAKKQAKIFDKKVIITTGSFYLASEIFSIF